MVRFMGYLPTKIKRKKQTDTRRLHWPIVHWRWDVDWLCIGIGLPIPVIVSIRLLIPVPVAIGLLISSPIPIAIAIMIATLVPIVIATPITPSMTVVMISER